MRELYIYDENNKNREEIKKRIKDHRNEQEEKSREKIKEYFLKGQMNPTVTIFSLHLLGISTKKAKELIKQWTNEITQC